MASAWLEPLSCVIRVGVDGAKHCDSYHLAATVRYLSIDEVEVVGVCNTVAKSDWEAMVKCFRDNGVKRILFKRIKNGRVREVWLDLTRQNKCN